MEVIITDKGHSKGRINVTKTLASLRQGESWETNTTEVDPDYVRVKATKLARALGREFSVSHTQAMGDTIIITRIS